MTMPTSIPLSRRSFLRGASLALPLPFLEAMLPRRYAHAQVAPLRYVVMFGGMELAGQSTPAGAGPTYTLPAAFAPLESVRGAVTLISGLTVPRAATPPPAGIPTGGGFHNVSVGPILGGTTGFDGRPNYLGPTSDQVVAAAIAGGRYLAYRAQPVPYVGGLGYMTAGPGGAKIDPVASPSFAYTTLFSGFAGPSGGTLTPGAVPSGTATTPPPSAVAVQRQLARDKSVLDMVATRSGRLMARLGAADKLRVQRHFDEIRALEMRIALLAKAQAPMPMPSMPGTTTPPPPPATGASTTCRQPSAPGADPSTQSIAAGANGGGTTGYSNEDLRAEIFVGLIHLALTCNLRQVATLMLTYAQSQMSVEPLIGIRSELHSITHNQGIPAGTSQVGKWQEANAWHVKHFAALVQKLASTPDGTGTLLDNTFAAFTFSGGQGPHGCPSMVMATAGRGAVLKTGQHISAVGEHPAHVLQTGMRAVGVTAPLGDAPGVVAALMR
jgi:hypothetical protein